MKKIIVFMYVCCSLFIFQGKAQNKELKLSNLLIKNTDSYYPIGLKMDVEENENPYLLQFSVNFPGEVSQLTYSLGTSRSDPESILKGFGNIIKEEQKFLLQLMDEDYELEELPSPYENLNKIYFVTIPLKIKAEQLKLWKYARVYVTDKKGKTKIINKEIK